MLSLVDTGFPLSRRTRRCVDYSSFSIHSDVASSHPERKCSYAKTRRKVQLAIGPTRSELVAQYGLDLQ